MPAMLMPYLSARTRRYVERYRRRTPNEMHSYPRARGAGTRLDAWPDKPGHIPGSDPELLRAQLLDEWGVDYAVLQVMASMDCYDRPEIAAELARAVNDGCARNGWSSTIGCARRSSSRTTTPTLRLLKSSGVPPIRGSWRSSCPRARRSRWLGAILARLRGGKRSPSADGLSHRRLHAPLGAGPPSYYLAYHVDIACMMQSQLTSMVASGMFAALPDLRLILTECGMSWAAALRWAMDAAWDLMGADHPHLERRPSEYMRDHVWFTTQPIEEPADPRHLLYAIEQA